MIFSPLKWQLLLFAILIRKKGCLWLFFLSIPQFATISIQIRKPFFFISGSVCLSIKEFFSFFLSVGCRWSFCPFCQLAVLPASFFSRPTSVSQTGAPHVVPIRLVLYRRSVRAFSPVSCNPHHLSFPFLLLLLLLLSLCFFFILSLFLLLLSPRSKIH